MPPAGERSTHGLYVLAGTNGAGKSSILGRDIALVGSDFLNPDLLTVRLMEDDPLLSVEHANEQAWYEMVRLLRTAIDQRLDFAFETTLGGNTVTNELLRAGGAGLDVRVAYVGLASADLHVERVRRRVAEGGHDIPEARIRARYVSSRENLIRMLPVLRELFLFDNSREGDPADPARSEPTLVMHMEYGQIDQCDLLAVPDWARPIVAAALGLP